MSNLETLVFRAQGLFASEVIWEFGALLFLFTALLSIIRGGDLPCGGFPHRLPTAYIPYTKRQTNNETTATKRPRTRPKVKITPRCGPVSFRVFSCVRCWFFDGDGSLVLALFWRVWRRFCPLWGRRLSVCAQYRCCPLHGSGLPRMRRLGISSANRRDLETHPPPPAPKSSRSGEFQRNRQLIAEAGRTFVPIGL